MARRPAGLPWVIGVSCLAVLAGLLAVGGDRPATLLDTTDGVRPPPMVPTMVPDGLEPAAALDLPLAGGAVPTTALVLYGDPDAADPFGEGDVAVLATGTAGRPAETATGPDAVAVRGRPATFTEAFAGPDLGLKALGWVDEGDTSVQVVSRSLTRDELLDVAAALDVAGGTARAARPLPRGLRIVARQSRASVPSGSAPIPLGVSGHVVSYTSPAGDAGPQRHLLVGSHAGGAEVLTVLRWYYGATARPQAVSGHAGVLASLVGSRSQSCAVTLDRAQGGCDPAGSEAALVLAWATASEVVVMSSSGVSETDLLGSASTVSAVDDASWQRLRAAANRRQADQGDAASRGSNSGPATTAPAPG